MPEEDAGQQELALDPEAQSQSPESETTPEAAETAPESPPTAVSLEAMASKAAAQAAAETAARLAPPPAAPAPEKPVRVTAADLERKVDEGEMTMMEAVDLLTKQKEVDLLSQMEEREQANRLFVAAAAEVEAYKKGRESLSDPTSDDFKRVQAEYSKLATRYGVPKEGSVESMQMQADACERAFGSPVKAKEVTRRRGETHVETTSGGVRGESSATTGDGPPSWLNNDQKAWYNDRIKDGMYKGWKDPDLVREAEIIRDGDPLPRRRPL